MRPGRSALVTQPGPATGPMSVVRKWDSTGKESERGGRVREEGETACGGEEKEEGEEQEDVVVVWAGNG